MICDRPDLNLAGRAGGSAQAYQTHLPSQLRSLLCMCTRPGGHVDRDARSSSRHFLGVMNEQATSFWMSSERNDTLV